ncbi:class I SAM-dependent methyltransferase [Xanthobacter autotrophicus]|uniref:class I SAM-dependent methyltransferase n=1 Tax=Xanthobacter TaxID=279 RepID=UPI0024AC4707|nr:class I SAM-dependent methyltransferase [Xanthobacter autotrophicus]MDI4666674.1 class I SAM-dependent methyltransferase [Xanthobacter autotrophicus]
MTDAATGAARSHEAHVADMFGPQAAAYVASAVHARGADLEALSAVVAELRPGRLLDLGCGGGHVSFAASPFAGEVVAYDLSADMLGAVAVEAEQRGLANVVTRQGVAERLPFADASFDFVATRYSAHHWRNVPAAMGEARRVLKAEGRAMVMDVIAPDWPVADSFLQAIEMLRDPSHGRDYREAEWVEHAEGAGFRVMRTARRRLRLEFRPWVERIRTSDLHAAAIRSLIRGASRDVAEHFEIEADGSFTLDTLTLELEAA